MQLRRKEDERETTRRPEGLAVEAGMDGHELTTKRIWEREREAGQGFFHWNRSKVIMGSLIELVGPGGSSARGEGREWYIGLMNSKCLQLICSRGFSSIWAHQSRFGPRPTYESWCLIGTSVMICISFASDRGFWPGSLTSMVFSLCFYHKWSIVSRMLRMHLNGLRFLLWFTTNI